MKFNEYLKSLNEASFVNFGAGPNVRYGEVFPKNKTHNISHNSRMLSGDYSKRISSSKYGNKKEDAYEYLNSLTDNQKREFNKITKYFFLQLPEDQQTPFEFGKKRFEVINRALELELEPDDFIERAKLKLGLN